MEIESARSRGAHYPQNQGGGEGDGKAAGKDDSGGKSAGGPRGKGGKKLTAADAQ